MANITELEKQKIKQTILAIKELRSHKDYKNSDKLRQWLIDQNVIVQINQQGINAEFYIRRLLSNGVYSPQFEIMRV